MLELRTSGINTDFHAYLIHSVAKLSRTYCAMKLKRRVGGELKGVVLYVQLKDIHFPVLVPYVGLHGCRVQHSSFFFIPLRKESCVYCAQVYTSESSQMVFHPLEQETLHLTQHAPVSSSSCPRLSMSLHAERWELAMVQKWSAFMQTPRDLCVSFWFQWKWKVSRSNKIYFEVCNLPEVHSGSISCTLKWLLIQHIKISTCGH